MATLANNDYVIVRLPLGLNTIEADVFDGDDLNLKGYAISKEEAQRVVAEFGKELTSSK